MFRRPLHKETTMRLKMPLALLFVCLPMLAQLPQGIDLQALKQAAGAQGDVAGADAVPKRPTTLPVTGTTDPTARQQSEDEKLDAEIKAMKAREKGPRRFGDDLFKVRSQATAATEGGIAEDYVLGTGDRLNLNVFGSATFDLPVQVDGRGEIVIPKVGTAKVAGMTLGKAKAAVQSLVSRNFSRSSVDVQVIKLREVRVFLLGEVYKPGSYLVPSLSSLVNVLGLAGGPNSAGSFRDIRVMRGGKVLHSLDLYPLRAEGVGNMNISLQNGDVIFVPVAGTKVLMDGAFLRVVAPTQDMDAGGAIQLELRPEESAWHAVRFMGGLLPSAYTSLITLQRVDPTGVVNVENIANAEATLRATRLFPNDVLRALSQAERTEGVVEVAGTVRVPGRFAHRPGLRVKDLLLGQSQLLPSTYLGRGEVLRTTPDERLELLPFDVSKALAGDLAHNLALTPRDKITLYTVTELRLPKKVSVVGPFTKPGTFDWAENMRASDLLFRAGIPQLSANRLQAELAHTRDGKPSEIVNLDLSRLITTEGGSPVDLKDDGVNPRLQPDDQISLFEKPDYRVHRTVRISGQVARPGTYVLDQDHPTLSQLVKRAGGMTAEAMPKAGVLLRNAMAEVGPGAKSINDIMDRLNETKLLADKSTGTGEGAKSNLLRPPILHGVGATKFNRLVVDFEKAVRGDKAQDTELLDGDEVVIPRLMDTAYVVGESSSPFGSFKVVAGMTVGDLLKMAGGTTRNADTSNIRLVKADGHIIDSWVKGKKVEPGDTVIVPQRFRRDTNWQDDLTALTPLALILNVFASTGHL